MTEGRYWDRSPAAEAEMSFEEAAAGVRERLIRSVELRLRADVPLAFCMSGGVDSLSLISIARRELDYDVHGFTILNSDERYEERRWSTTPSRSSVCATPASRSSTSASCRVCAGWSAHHDAPVCTISYYVHWLLMEAIHEHGYRVSVSGTAADELYSGYYDHHLLYLRRERRRAGASGVGGARPARSRATPSCRTRTCSRATRRSATTSTWMPTSLPRCCPSSSPSRSRRHDFDAGLLRGRMLNELFYEAVPVILHEDDLNAMFFSIENRSPFLDRELYESRDPIPARQLVRDGRAKAVLREAMRGIGPSACSTTAARSASTPRARLARPRDPAVRDEVLAESPVFEVVRREAVEELLDGATLPNSRSKFLFNFTCAKLFLEESGDDAPMDLRPNDPPRRFSAGEVTISHVADLDLEPDEQVTFVSGTGTEYDVARKDWGYYATPSLNGRLAEHGLRAALAVNADSPPRA